MISTIHRAAVVGAGVMGAALAAHLANAGVPTLLLDIIPPEGSGIDGDHATRTYRDAFARTGLERALKAKPASFFTREVAHRVTVGNLDDDVAALGDVDLVIEAIVEKIGVKTALFERIAPHLSPTAILATNTSGLSVQAMADALPDALRPRFLGMHFFNPPRYLHLLELTPHAATSPEVLAAAREFGEVILGKGTVVAKDTPDFIANRIGGFAVMSVMRAMLDGGYTVEEVDALTGPIIGRPKSATFRTADLVGLDILVHAARTVYDGVPDDEMRAYFKPPEVIEKMLAQGKLGQKSGGGFYRKEKHDGKSVIRTLDLETLEYRERVKPAFPSLELARTKDGVGARIGAILGARDRASDFLWRTLSEMFLYSARRVGEVADDIVSVDRAMRWGFGWRLGPFEMWDAVGVEQTVERMRAEGTDIPEFVEAVLATPEKKFYAVGAPGEVPAYFTGGARESVPTDERAVDLARLQASGATVKKNAGASLIDLGDGVLCVEFHSKMNAIGADIVSMLMAGVREAETNYEALVIANQGRNFSVGANIMLLLLEAQEGNFEEIDGMVRRFQRATSALKYSRVPVVAAPFGMTLGGGCEVVLGAGHAMASAETYIGQVELGVGLIPAGGGCKELLMRSMNGRPRVEGVDPFPFTRAAFETIGLAKVSTSAMEARDMGILRDGDGIAMNPDHQIWRAKQMALGLARAGYTPPDPAVQVPVAGEGGMAALYTHLFNLKDGGHISEYDAYLGGELARILCGGDVPAGTMVNETYLLNLEREVFLRLCGQRKTLERIGYMLKKGKPLRN